MLRNCIDEIRYALIGAILATLLGMIAIAGWAIATGDYSLLIEIGTVHPFL